SYAALRLPAPISHGSGSPYRWLTSLRVLVLCPLGRRHVHSHTCRASETGHRLSARPECIEERRGPPRLRDRPLHTCHGRTPRRRPPPPRPDDICKGVLLPSGKTGPSASGKTIGFGAACPMAHMFARLRIADHISGIVARLTTGSGGLTLGRAGFAPAGRQTKFHVVIASSFPFDPHCLVALFSLSVRRGRGSCAPPRAWRGSGSSRAGVRQRASSWRRSMAGSPKALTPPTCARPPRCSTPSP